MKKTPQSSLIKVAVADAMSSPVIKLQRIRQGIVNRVYKVKTSRKNFIVRIFKYQNWPEDGNLEWIENQLRKQHIAHAKLLYYTRDNKFFPHGFMISEYIDGVDGWTAIKKSYHSLPESWYENGKVLREVHKIKLDRYGEINYGRGIYEDFIDFKLEQEVRRPLKPLIKAKLLPSKIYKDFVRITKENLLPFKKRFQSVLVHTDAGRDNSIVTPRGQFILIDWDNAKSGIAIEDFTNLTCWFPTSSKWNSLKLRESAKTAFLKGYGDTGFSQKEIAQLEKGLHPIYALNVMEYYFSGLQDMSKARNIRKYLLALLSGRK